MAKAVPRFADVVVLPKTHQALVKDKRFDDLLHLMPAAQTSDKTAVVPEQITPKVR
jgi:septum site-determining protein MinD